MNEISGESSSNVEESHGAPQSSDQKTFLKRGPWSAEEDDLLRLFVQAYGDGVWGSAKEKAGLQRSATSCARRYRHFLDPSLKSEPITEEEGDRILSLQKELGNKWSMIAKQLPGRNGHAVKSWFDNHLAGRPSKRPKCAAPPPSQNASSMLPANEAYFIPEQSNQPVAPIPKHEPPDPIAYWQHLPLPPPPNVPPAPRPPAPFHAPHFAPTLRCAARACGGRSRPLTVQLPLAPTTFAPPPQPLFPSVPFPDPQFPDWHPSVPFPVAQPGNEVLPVGSFSAPPLDLYSRPSSANPLALPPPVLQWLAHSQPIANGSPSTHKASKEQKGDHSGLRLEIGSPPGPFVNVLGTDPLTPEGNKTQVGEEPRSAPVDSFPSELEDLDLTGWPSEAPEPQGGGTQGFTNASASADRWAEEDCRQTEAGDFQCDEQGLGSSEEGVFPARSPPSFSEMDDTAGGMTESQKVARRAVEEERARLFEALDPDCKRVCRSEELMAAARALDEEQSRLFSVLEDQGR
ncbi:myb proto-oncogene protein [Klebsormidium nitens]|uniref:Myb proto-oncogene protein n=1 Tax=Klebsormidium nitens TaxID=105231 RepID=A0A1Y1I7T9_KLENI|nr:myb proto-oncogene protein [Klebsormidium nitens]|eukprot:GAQ85211.1 myb proto-oncogene protein [Klebsormidium nitens]